MASLSGIKRMLLLLLFGCALVLAIAAGNAQATVPGMNGSLLISSLSGPYDDDPIYISHLYELGLDGSQRELVMPDSNYSPALAPGGSRLAFVRNPSEPFSQQLWVGDVHRLDAARQVTFDTVLDPMSIRDPVFAPDGKSIVYSTSYVGNFPGVDDWKLGRYWLKSGRSSEGPVIVSNYPRPDISPNGRTIAFSTGSLSSSRIWFIKGIGAAKTSFPTTVPARAPSFSPDGRKVAFLGYVDGLWQVFISRIDGTHQRMVTHDATSIFSVVFSPDGSMIAYQRGMEESAQLVIRSLRSGVERTLTYPGTDPELTEWSRRKLFEVLVFKPRSRLVKVRVFGPGVILARSGKRILGRRKAPGAGIYKVRLDRRFQRRTTGKVVFRPRGGLSGSKPLRSRVR